jgi:Cu+-exporting ATPase
VALDGQLVGALGARDRVRAEAHDVIHDLKHLGLKDITVLTGDRPSVAKAVGKKVHVKSVEAELTPEGKAHWIHHRQHEGKTVGMVGDGINDAPALAMADVGIAIGGAGADIAAEAGNVILLGDPLAPLPDAIRLSRQATTIIRQNILLFAFGVNSVAVLLAGLRVLGPVSAAIFHQIGSLLVLLNAMRLLGVRDGQGRSLVLDRLRGTIDPLRPSLILGWALAHRGRLATGAAVLVLIGWIGSGLAIVGPDEVGLLRRFGRFVPPVLGPGLHWRLPAPLETISILPPSLVRSARVGLVESPSSGATPIAWNATHGASRDDSALFFTGDENLVELAGIVEYQDTRRAFSPEPSEWPTPTWRSRAPASRPSGTWWGPRPSKTSSSPTE